MDTLFNPTPDDDLKQVLAGVPPQIRAFIASGKVQIVARNLMQKNQLHIDQGAIVGRELMLLLLGINTPSEFTQALAEEAKLTKIVIDGIVQDVNNQIFVPLRKEEEKGSMTATEVRPSPEIPKVEPQIQPASHFTLQNKIPIPPASMPKKDWSNLPPTPMKGTLPPKVFLPRPSTLGDVVRSVLSAPKPVDTDKLLEDHEEPHIAFEAKSPEVRPRGIPVRPVVAPENLPGVMMEQTMHEAPIPEVQHSPILKVEPQIQPMISIPVEVAPEFLKVEPQIPKPAPVAPIEPKSVPAPITSYSSDPYREPIDEPPTE